MLCSPILPKQSGLVPARMDEDYTLDLKNIKEVAIGIVNPMGVGQVEFQVTSIETLTLSERGLTAAECVVDGKTLSVNDHETIPAGILAAMHQICQRNIVQVVSGNILPHLPVVRPYRKMVNAL